MITTVSSTAISARRVAIAGAIGTAIEWYDFFIYGTAAAVVFAPQFFPQVSPLAGTLAAFATFGIGFIARPLGGVVMGHFGDRLGRKSMLVWSLLLMGIATTAIGLLPNYARIGVWAPLLLIACRFVQGFALGGEWGGAVLMSVEHAPPEQRGYFGGLVALGLPAGVVLSNLVFLLSTLFVAPAQFADWGWRIPFVASAVLVAAGLLVRLGLSETPLFHAVQRARAERRMPIVDVMRTHRVPVLLAAGSYVGVSTLGYIVLVYVVSYATRQLAMPLPLVLAQVLLAAVVMSVSIVATARSSDRIGRRRLMRWGNGGMALWTLIFFPLLDTRSAPLVALALCGIFVLQGAYLGVQPAVFAELFPTTTRYSGASLSLTLGTIVGGAPAPFVATWLFGLTGTSTPITIYLVAVTLLSWLCVMAMRETFREAL